MHNACHLYTVILLDRTFVRNGGYRKFPDIITFVVVCRMIRQEPEDKDQLKVAP